LRIEYLLESVGRCHTLSLISGKAMCYNVSYE